MTTRRQAELLALLLCCLACLAVIGERRVSAQGRESYAVKPEFRDEGRDVVLVATSAYPSAWNLIVSSDAVRRHLRLQWLSRNSDQVCVSTTSKTGDACSDSTPGITLSSTTPTFDEYGHVAWYIRSYNTSQTTQTIKGYYARDRNDFGHNQDLNDPLQ